jgi:hypothetical protein
MRTAQISLAVCVAGAPRSLHLAEVHTSLVRHLLTPFCESACERLDVFVLLKNETFSRSAALNGMVYDPPRGAGVEAALRLWRRRATSVQVERWPEKTYTAPCAWKGRCAYGRLLARAHVQSVVGQMHSWSWCARRAANHDWLVVTRPDVLFRRDVAGRTRWSVDAVSMSDSDPRERVMVVPRTRLTDVARGWKRWKACESRLPDLGCATQPETVLQHEAGALRIPAGHFGDPTFVRELNGTAFREM